MSIDITHALKEGLNRSLKRNGVILFVVFLVFGAVTEVATQSILATILPQLLELVQESAQRPLPSQTIQVFERPQPLAVSIPIEGGIALFLVMFVLGQTARVLSDRTFISDESERLHEPGRWLVPATLSSIASVIIIAVLFVLLYIPVVLLGVISPVLAILGVLVAVVVAIAIVVSFFFFRQEIASEDVGPIDALSNSWSLVSGDRLTVLGLAALLFILSFIIIYIGQSIFIPISLRAGTIASIVIAAALVVFDSAVAAQVYRQLCMEKRDTDGTDKDDEDDWEPDDKWNDPPL